jgi:hypothetical protein
VLRHAHRIGAVGYALWGVIHMLGGAAMLATLANDGGTAYLAMVATAMPVTLLPVITAGPVTAVFAFHAYNLVWLGAVVTLIAVTLNWHKDRSGYWLNLAIVSATDLGLLGTTLAPGYMLARDGAIGLVLWAIAACFSTLALRNAPGPRDTATSSGQPREA